jgi:drug/metabolite transporter (DMT)-like permease
VKRSRFLPFIALVVLMVIWGYSWVPGKLGVVNSNPFMFAAFRTLPGALILLALLPITGRSLRPKAILMTATVGVLQVSGFVGFISAALASGGAGHGAMLANTWQFWLLLLAWLFLGERLVRYQWLAVGVALAGLVLIIEPWGVRGVTSSLLTLAGALIFSAGTVLFKVFRKRYEIDLLSLTAWQSFFGCLPLVVLAFAVPGDPIQWNFDFIYAIVFSALIGTALGGLLWLYVLNALPANLAGIGTIGTPVVGVLSSWLLLGERLSGWEIAGMVLVVSALALLVLYGSGLLRRAAPAAVTPQQTATEARLAD